MNFFKKKKKKKEEGKSRLWEELYKIHGARPWLLMGDFNDILRCDERIRKRAHSIPGR